LRRKAIEDYHLDITDGKNSFPRQPFHKVVAISFLEAEIERDSGQEGYVLKDLRSGGEAGFDEKQLLQGFFTYVERIRPRLVSFNGRSFDLPVLKYRAMVHGISAPWLHKSGDKWNSYSYRFATDWHCDLLEVLSDFGASARVKLNEVCAAFGIAGKFGVDGSKVAEMMDAGQIDEIRHYCETDVLNTYLVYLRYQLHTGTLSKTSYNAAVADVISFIDAEKENRPYLNDFMNAWGEASDNKFILD
jgi:predicted PolB exonuclease-like 3'-5' exonuclease